MRLTHIYHGPAFHCEGDGAPGRLEMVSGCFAAVAEDAEHGVLIDNGEGEQWWVESGPWAYGATGATAP